MGDPTLATGATIVYTGTGHACNRGFNLTGGTAGDWPTINASGNGALELNQPNNACASGSKLLVLTGTSTALNKIGGIIPSPTTSGQLDVDKLGTGTWVLNGLNTFNGYASVKQGTLVINTLADMNTACSLGKQASHAIGRISLGANGAATLKYTGTGHGSNRRIKLKGSYDTTIDASGAGALALDPDAFTAGTGSRTIFLRGTSTSALINSITKLADPTSGTLSVTKDDANTWQLNSAMTHTGTHAAHRRQVDHQPRPRLAVPGPRNIVLGDTGTGLQFGASDHTLRRRPSAVDRLAQLGAAK